MKFNAYRDTDHVHSFVGLSFGGGVQSTALLLLIHHEETWLRREIGHIPQKAYFSDTGLEKQETLDHIKQLKEAGYFQKAPLEQIETHLYEQMDKIPFYIQGDDGQMTMMKRRCTADHKILPLRQMLRRDFKAQGGMITEKAVALWLGISTDEIQRMKESGVKYIEHIFPLIELGWDRAQCQSYLRDMGWKNVSRSACYCCPYRKDWATMKRTSPESFQKAVEVDNNLRRGGKYNPPTLGKDLYLLRDGTNLADFNQAGDTPLINGLLEECDGMCGN